MAEIIKIKAQKQLKNSACNANATEVLPIPNNMVNSHGFFNDLTILNTSSSDIEVTPDNDVERSFIVPAKGNMRWSFKDDNMKYSALKYKELSGSAIDANNIQFIMIKKRIEVLA